jgi:ParB family transcriptional regulator, chromosome partitioning protein
MTRKALGRGLSALIRDVESGPTSGVSQVPIDLIDPNPLQPRRRFDAAGLQELADSIRGTGVVQPVLLRPSAAQTGRHELIAGERRFRAAKLAGLSTIPALMRSLSDQEALEIALTENLLREDLNALEVAHAYLALQAQFSLSHDEIAERLGVSRVSVTNTLRLLKLPEEIQQMLESGEITAGHARALLSLEDGYAQIKLAQSIRDDTLSVRQIEKHVADLIRKPEPQQPKPAKELTKLDPNLKAAIRELERTLGTRVKITGNEKHGQIQISYFSPDDLTRIYDLIVKPM